MLACYHAYEAPTARLLDPGRRVRPCGCALGVRFWRQLRIRQALEKARLVGQVAGAAAAVHGSKRFYRSGWQLVLAPYRERA